MRSFLQLNIPFLFDFYLLTFEHRQTNIPLQKIALSVIQQAYMKKMIRTRNFITLIYYVKIYKPKTAKYLNLLPSILTNVKKHLKKNILNKLLAV